MERVVRGAPCPAVRGAVRRDVDPCHPSPPDGRSPRRFEARVVARGAVDVREHLLGPVIGKLRDEAAGRTWRESGWRPDRWTSIKTMNQNEITYWTMSSNDRYRAKGGIHAVGSR